MSIEKIDGTIRVVEGWVMYAISKEDGVQLCRYRIPRDCTPFLGEEFNWGETDDDFLNAVNGEEHINDLLWGLDESIDMHLVGCEMFKVIGFDKVFDSKFVGIMGMPEEHETFNTEFDAIKSVCDVTLKEVA